MTYISMNQVPDVPYTAYEKVGVALDLGDEPPEGLLARYAGETETGFAVVAVWATKAHAERFSTEHLEPALHKVHGPDLPTGESTGFEALDVFVT